MHVLVSSLVKKGNTSSCSSIVVYPVLQEMDNAWIIVQNLFPAQSASPVRESSPRNTLRPLQSNFVSIKLSLLESLV